MFLLVLLIFPFLEFYVMLQVGDEIGFFQTLGLLFLSGWFGYILIRTRGLVLLYQMQSHLLQGQSPQKEVVRGVLTIIAGLLFIVPGFISDVIGMLFLLPIARDLVAVTLLWWLKARVKKGNFKVYSSVGGFGHAGGFNRSQEHSPFNSSVNSGIRDVTPLEDLEQSKLPPSDHR